VARHQAHDDIVMGLMAKTQFIQRVGWSDGGISAQKKKMQC
jgi:hypothetical protein